MDEVVVEREEDRDEEDVTQGVEGGIVLDHGGRRGGRVEHLQTPKY